MNRPDQNPIVMWCGIVFTLLSVAVATGAGYIFAENLMIGIQANFKEQRELRQQIRIEREAEKFGDQLWVELDTAQSRAIMDAVNSLRALIEHDGTLLYQLGLRDGQTLCEAGQ